MENEIWKDIAEMSGNYQVSSLGRVKSVDRTVMRDNGWFYPVKERILKPAKDRCGYLRCGLIKDKKLTTRKVHRLVADAFCSGNIAEMTVDHLNGIKADNRACNLEIVTQRENVKRSFSNGLQPSKRGVLNGRAKLSQPQVDMIRECFSHESNQNCKKGTKPFSSRWLAKAFRSNKKTIQKIVKGDAY